MQDAPDPESPLAAPLTVVALGASAGGLEALKAFFGDVQPDPGVAYVVLTHLPASHDSHLDQLLGRVTRLPVTQAQSGHQVQGGHVYLGVPGALMGITGGQLTIEGAVTQAPMAMSLPIDHFMFELAEDLGENAVGIVLSGTAHDGTAGLKAIRAAGGLTLVQSPGTAEFPGMPNSAIAAGTADQVLAAQDMPAALADYLCRRPVDLPAEEPETVALQDGAASDTEGADDSLLVVLSLLQTRMGHDFRGYRPAMLRRRLRRRMVLCKLDRVQDYITLLDGSNDELDTLKNEFLIGVTDFFRDPSTWAELAQTVIPELVDQRLHDDAPIRVWTPGCATGEESYSIAMLMLEQAEGKIDPQRIQVFGTDIDLNALSVARTGAYPASIVSTVSAQRIAKFFDRRGERYVARKSLRNTILFAPQNLVRDTPFSKLDLVVCRNLLIYLKPELQQRVFELFHFALKPGGLLLLGKAESICSQTELFAQASRSMRLYRRTGTAARLPSGFGNHGRLHGGHFDDRAREGQLDPSPGSSAELVRLQLNERAVTGAVLVDRDSRALYFYGNTAPFLQLQGKASLELSALVHPPLRVRVRTVLRSVLGEGTAASSSITLHQGEHSRRIHLEAEPATAMGARGLALVMFTLLAQQDSGDDAKPAALAADADWLPQFDEAREELAAALEDTERSNEELRSANEETLALNEELQSSNEELESSKEKLESLNEELTSSNALLDEKIDELALRNDDLTNLLVSTGMGTILLDASLRIRRFTPSVSQLFNLQPGDEGRLLSDISSSVNDPELETDLGRVTQLGLASFAEVGSTAGQTYLRRVQPYRTEAGKLEGAVVTFTDVTALREASQRLRELMAVLQDSSDAIILYDCAGKILDWNNGAQRIYGHSREAMIGTSFYALLPPGSRGAAQDLAAGVCATGMGTTRECQRIRRDGTAMSVSITVSALRDLSGKIYALISTERDISQLLRSENEMYFRRLADHIPVLLRVEDAHGLAIFVNHPCTEFTGLPREALLGDGWLQFVHPQDRERYLGEHARVLAEQSRLEIELRMRRADGIFRWMRSINVPHFNDQDEFVGYVGLMVDVEEQKLAEAALRDADRRKDGFLAMLAHELRNPLAPIRTAAMLIERTSAADSKTAWAVSVIRRQTELLAKLLDDLLDVARIARGKIVLEKAPVEVAVLMQRAVEIAQPLIDSLRHQLFVSVPDEPIMVEGDLARLTQVLANLLTNAAKYTDEGGQLRFELGRDGPYAVIRVRDTGMGMAPEVMCHIFEPFTQADSSLDRSRGGLGLGLTLVKQLVDLHGGAVEARSPGIGQGSEFIVRLPLLRRGTPVADAVITDQGALPGGRSRILVVDDNRDTAETLAVLLQSEGHEVSVAYDGKEALDIAAHNHFQVVVLDVGLPGLDGYQVARRLRGAAATAHVKLIAVTGYGQPDDVARAQAAGFDHHLVKPVDPEAILKLAVCEPHQGPG